eukprot:CAMPEP_0113668226 /NCGR_PEP_ID=MMETSP0038_2-20120614/3886_1 /TAXON_ID=2898 /ORGANISM="Cryptomonas paramecium" /LENGTH=116 /DNA_ID=CAMNT_0000583953 /DNA_START=10 /DNA_END=360 /DNA_ORIENTATION=+ /assembly_acc=CAM_ASM_000170
MKSHTLSTANTQDTFGMLAISECTFDWDGLFERESIEPSTGASGSGALCGQRGAVDGTTAFFMDWFQSSVDEHQYQASSQQTPREPERRVVRPVPPKLFVRNPASSGMHWHPVDTQ